MKTRLSLIMAVVMVFGITVQAHASLIEIGTATYNSADYKLIYDDDLGITWLDYTKSVDTWDNQMTWADGLNASSVLTYNLNPGVTMSWTGNWRLPTAPGIDYGDDWEEYFSDDGEMGHLYYTELLNPVGGPLINTGPFTDLQPYEHWSGTEYDADRAWLFDFASGNYYYDDKDIVLHRNALAVRPGALGASVPEPSTMILLGFGLGGLAAFRKKFRKG